MEMKELSQKLQERSADLQEHYKIDPTLDKYSVLSQALTTWGREAQELMAVEECSELIKALCKIPRGGSADDVIEEIADVQIMLDQMKIIYGEAEIRRMEYAKLCRLEDRLNSVKLDELMEEDGICRTGGLTMEWISVKDRLPDKGNYVLVFFDDGFIATVVYNEDFELWWDSGEPTHWMPLPEPPTKSPDNPVSERE